VLNLPKARLLVFSFGARSSGTFSDWAAKSDAPGVNVLAELSEGSALAVAGQIATLSRPGDLVVVSVHWGSNWGYDVADEQRIFARNADRQGGLTDYEGIEAYKGCRDDLVPSRSGTSGSAFRRAWTLT
jgi:poly-gamma-glutamate capsule biosynthesis protein CapA/YwtB (metallophosphatase superfamily)